MSGVPIYTVGPQLGGFLYVPDLLNNREAPQAREPSKCLNGQSYGAGLDKEAFDGKLQEAQSITLIEP